MPEGFLDWPQWQIILGLAGLVVLVVLLLSLVVLFLGSALARRPSGDGPSLAELAGPLLRLRRGRGKFDADFERLARGTLLGIDGETAVASILFSAAILATAAYLVAVDFLSLEDGLLVAMGAALAGGGATFAVFYFLRNRRRRRIQEQLPDGCFQLSRSLRSGLVLAAALKETSHYLHPPLAGLFKKLAGALALGESTRAALRRAAADADLTEFDLFAEVLALNAESGGNLPAMLDRLAASIRDRNQYRGYYRSVTALNRMAAGFLVLAVPIAFLLYLLDPDLRAMLLRFLQADEGHMIMGIAAVLEVAGLAWIAVLLRRQDDY